MAYYVASIAMANLLQQFMTELIAPRAWFLLLLPLFLLLARYSVTTNRARKRQQQDKHDDDDNLPLPPSPPALPVLGHLHLIGSLPHVSLRNLAAKHGSADLMLLRLGAMPVLVVSSPRAAEAVLRTHDHVFASRPRSVVAEVVLYGSSDIGFAPYGDAWRKARKLVTTHLLTVRRVQAFRRAREEEVGTVVARIAEAAAAGAAVDVGQLLGSFLNDLVCRAVMGKSSGRRSNKLLRELVADTSPLLGGFNVEEFFPFLARFGVLSKVVRAKSERLRKRWDQLLDGLIDDHESMYEPMAAVDPASEIMDEDQDFIHILLSVRQEYGLTRESMKAILLDVFFGGIDTGASLLEYTIIELIQRPHVMNKLQAEVRSSLPQHPQHQGQDEDIVREADLNNMSYLRAVIKESLRLRTVAPLLAPHLSMARCAIDGVEVPAGVRVLINFWAIGRDARFWGEDAEEFVPERFLGGGSAAEVSFRGTDFQFLPFSAGRRQCPGINFGMAAVEVMLANLVRRFDWEMPAGKAACDIDMAEEFGLVVHRKEKLLLEPKLCA